MLRIHRPLRMTHVFWAVLASLALAGCSSCDGASDAPPGDNAATNNLNSNRVDPGNPRVSRLVAPMPVVHLSDAGH
ncbi:MAG: hypothetical protein ABI461_03760 [Polyangiaceae bacterium]